MKRVMFCLLAAFGLASALAAQEPVAKIGDTTYSSLQAAFDAAADGATVTLLRNTDISGVGARVVRSLTLDLNGQTLSADNSKKGNLDVATGATLTLTDSTDTKKNGTGKGKILATQNYTSGNSGYSSGVVSVEPGATLVMERGLIDARRENPVANGQYGVVMNGSSTATIRGGAIRAGWYAIAGNGNDKETTSTITVEGGILESTADYAIYHPQGGTLTISGGTVAGAAGGVSINRGSCNITGGVVSSAGTGDTGDWGDGTGGQGKAAITVGARYDDVKLDISGGVITAPEGVACIATEETTHSADIAITGGTFSAALPAEFYSEGFLPVLTEEGTYEVSDTAAAAVITESGTIGYPSLAAAVNANKQGQTITLLKDLENQGAITIWSAGQETVIDLNGHTITFRNDESGDHRFQLLEGALTLTGTGTVTESKPAYGPMIIWASAEDAPDKCVLNVGPDVTLKGYQGVMIQGSNGNLKVGHGVSVTVEGKIVTMPASEDDPGCGVYINGQLQDTEGNVPKIVLAEGSSITTGGTGIYAAGYAEWTLAGDITAQEPLSIKCGTFDITGGTYHANGPFNDPAEANGNGSEPTGAAVSITTNDGYAPKTVVNITGGTFTSENGYAFYEGIATKEDGSPAAKASTAVIAISGGTFKGSTTNEAIKDSSAIAITTAENKRVISGGYFATPVPEEYCEYGYKPVTEPNEEKYYTVEHPQFTKIGVRLADGSYAVYDNFYAAYYGGLAQAGYKGTLVVLEDQETDASMNLMHDSTATAEVTLDLNGHTLTFTAGQYAIDCVRQDSSRSKPSLVITDSSAMQTGTIRATGAALDGVVRMVGGSLTITGGRFVQAVDDPNAQYKNNIFVVTEGMTIAPEGWRTVEVSGGTIRIEHSNVADVAEQGTAIAGGTFHSEAGRPAIEVAHATEGLVVSGGEFVGEGEALRISAPATVTVSGGDFADDTIAVADSGATLTLQDGRFDGATLAADNGGTLAIVGGPVDLSSAKIGAFSALSLQGEVAIGTNRPTQTAVSVDGTTRQITLTLTEAEKTAGTVDVLSAEDAATVPENLRFFVVNPPTDAALTAETVVADKHIRYVFTYLPIRVAGETTGAVFSKAVREALVAAAAEQGTRGILESVTGESAGRALTTEEVNDALACFEGDGLVVADGRALKVGYAFGIVGASYKAGTLTVTAQVQDLAGNPLAFANAEGLTLVNAATGDPIVGASAQVDEAAPGTVTFTATLQNAPETLRLAVKASTTAAD